MGELSAPAAGGLRPASVQQLTTAEIKNIRTKANFRWTIVLLFIVSLASFILCEQTITGWLAFGERANISRRDLNPLELLFIAGTAVWGLITLRTALDFLMSGMRQKFVSMHAYFEDKHSIMAPGVLLSIVLLTVIGLGSLLIAEQVATGWLALGERVNISRRDINWIELSVIIGGLLWGVVTLRTVYGLWRHDRRAWAYSQWVTLITSLIGLAIFASGLMDVHRVIPPRGTIFDNLPGVQELTGPGLLIFLSSVVAYRFLSIDTDTSAAQAVRNRLAQSPGAGAIVGFFVIAALFSLASDLFLEPRSLAGILATNITRGIVAIGITFLMISGEFDLSVGSVYGAGALVFLLMMTEGLPVAVLIGVPLVVAGLSLLALAHGRASYVIAGIIALAGAVLAPFVTQEELITTVIPAAIIALIFAGILGLINGVILIRTGIPSFIVTLGTLLAYRAILLVVVADGRILRYADYRLPPPYVHFDHRLLAIGSFALALVAGLVGLYLTYVAFRRFLHLIATYRDDPNDLRDVYLFFALVRTLVLLGVSILVIVLLTSFGLGQLNATTPLLEISFFDLANGRFDFVDRDVNLRIGVLWWAILVIVFQFVLTQTRYGNHVFAAGGNPGAARAQGINVSRVKVTNFIICSMLACLAGIINVARLANVDPLMGNGLELEVIAASVIGGALLSGGYGSIIGALLGVLIFGMLQTGLVLVGVDARAFSGVIGIIIIVAVVINTAVRRVRT